MPDREEEFQLFIARLNDHIEQLGRFFLCTVPAGVQLDQWAEDEDERLQELFDRPLRGRLKGERMDGRLQAIRMAVQSLDSAEAEQWLTPRFLEWDQFRPSYPLPATPNNSKRVSAFFEMLNCPLEYARCQVTCPTGDGVGYAALAATTALAAVEEAIADDNVAEALKAGFKWAQGLDERMQAGKPMYFERKLDQEFLMIPSKDKEKHV